jgi:hypothetical protein
LAQVICIVARSPSTPSPFVMPHVHSPLARSRRLGLHLFVVTSIVSTPLELQCSHILHSTFVDVIMPKVVAHRVPAFVVSIWTHNLHCQLHGQNIHTAGIAAARAQPLLGLCGCNFARSIHQIANPAKHNDFVANTSGGSSSFIFNPSACPFSP